MTENKTSGEAIAWQTEVFHPFFGISADSPGSDDSGVARSPISSCSSSMPSSPATPHSEDEFDPKQNGNLSIVDSCVNLEIATSSPIPDSPPVVTQTKGVDEHTIQKLLQLLKANHSSADSLLISNLLINVLGNSAKKSSALQSLLTSSKEDPKCQVPRRKRPSDCLPGDIKCKQLKIDAPKCRQVQPSIVLLEQPEKNYRARYESEGCRGPVHGSSDMTFPTIQVQGYSAGPLWVTVYLATNKGTPHFHLLCGPGSTKMPCRNILLPSGVPAIEVLVSPETEMTAVLDCISLKRRRNFEADKELERRGLDPVDWKSERKEACFIFTAVIPTIPSQVISCKSTLFQCTAPPGNPEIWWMKPVQGSAIGGDEIGLIGKKFPKGFKVRFFGYLPSGKQWEAYGDIDKSKSNTGAAVIRSPCLHHPITHPLTVNVEVCNCTSKGNNHVSSDSIEFTYLPLEKLSSVVPSGLDILPDNLEISELIDAMSQYVPESNEQTAMLTNENQEWEQILSAIEQLHRDGSITANQFEELKSLVILKDTILLQAFRSTRYSFSEHDFLDVFCQYLAGLTCPTR